MWGCIEVTQKHKSALNRQNPLVVVLIPRLCFQGCESTKTAVLGSVKIRIVFFILCTLSLLLLYKWPKVSQVLIFNQNHSPNLTILIWHWPFGAQVSVEGDVCWDLYKVPGCRLVDQRSFFSSADVVVFHNRELVQHHEKLPLDLPRPEGQRWAWLSLESPAHNGNLKEFPNIFNMTISYRRDADVYAPYGELQPRRDEGQPVEGAPPNKTVFACWVVSNYQNHHKRTKVYQELKALIPIQVYGQWSKISLSSENLLPTINRCYFYLAFENSQFKDYITEKLWNNAYRGGAVPVVLGAPLDDYTAVAPPHSFIHVDEFASVKDLAEFLTQLAKDEKRYGEYFTWKQKWKVKAYSDWRERLCQICTLYDSLPQHKVYSDLHAWDNAAST